MSTKEKVLIVFDGTSHYIIPKSELGASDSIEVNGEYDNIDIAADICEKLNEEANGRN